RHTRFSRDWSSDVCSSDLLNVVCKDPDNAVALFSASWFFLEFHQRYVKIVDAALNQFFHQNFCFFYSIANGRFIVFFRRQAVAEIGRASCREREWVWVGA